MVAANSWHVIVVGDRSSRAREPPMFPVLCLPLIASVGVVDDAADAPARPPIVVFLSDDHTLTDSSLYGSTDLDTPNMERVAAAGMTFDRAFVASPSCAPSRAALLTGLMPARNGAEANHSRPRAEIKKLPAYLQELGYEVVAFGKVAHYRQVTEYGFDLARHFNYHEDVAVGEAVGWLKTRESEKPLCLFVGTNWPHVPWPEPTEFDADALRIPPIHVDTPETRAARASYYQAVRTMDDELGRVYEAAYETLGDDTLFIHTSDHGAQWPFGKWNLYDDGIRTPLIAVWPGRIAAGVRTDAMASWVDLLPTLIEAAGGEVPPAPGENSSGGNGLDGRSLLPVLTGETDSHRDVIFTTHSGDGSKNVYPSRSVRDGRYKYIRNLHPEFEFNSHVTLVRKQTNDYWPSWVERAKADPDAARVVNRYQQRPAEELYDLAADPQELNNLADDPTHSERLTAMGERLSEWMAEQGDTKTVFGTPQLLPRPGPPPNVVTVFVDDMGWADLSCFGGTDVETKQIDRLAAEGRRFTQFYVNAPICSPSRTALTTGHYPARHRITSYLAHRAFNAERGMVDWLDVDAVTLPRLLSDAGYRAGHFGKWHMGGQRDVGEAPLVTAYGFDASLTNFEGLGPRVLPLLDAHDGSTPKRHDLGSAKLGRGPIEWEDRSVVTARFVDRAVEFVDAAADADEPFYLNLWPDDVHSPFFPPGLREGEKRELYLDVLTAMDAQLAPLFDRIRDDPALRDNTLILLASDNGPEPGAGTSAPLRGVKGQLYEGGVRSPLIVWGPGLLESSAAGTVNDTAVLSSVDLVRSLVTLTGTSPPDGYASDGEDLAATLLGLSAGGRTGPLFWRRPPDRPGPQGAPHPDLAVRDGKWKLLCDTDGSAARLYALTADPSESDDFAARHPKIARRLTRAVLDWNATLPADGVTGGE